MVAWTFSTTTFFLNSFFRNSDEVRKRCRKYTQQHHRLAAGPLGSHSGGAGVWLAGEEGTGFTGMGWAACVGSMEVSRWGRAERLEGCFTTN